ncbi:G5 domain-containing protein [Aerococcus urinaeequi]|uniref:G5 domain-containing protein n=1 Tax=Aerococcus urinaeequi TaxID=51665 RepID=UPI003AAECAA3
MEEAIDFQTIYRPNADLAVGETQVVQERQNGTLRKTYEIRTTNGESKRYLVDSQIVQSPTHQIIEFGMKPETQPEPTTIVPCVETVTERGNYNG